ncbi:peptidylprolyl isomerase [Geomonas edaphica]|uniref:peptidylprolyl isomerase n=1 Tax=Geomonas edaphica TaxID=2570226 RepID=UPI0010A84FA1|nr:peptidylprolyl isomerase [Geomonas edaphica]
MPHLKKIVSSTLGAFLLTAIGAGASLAEDAAAKAAPVQAAQTPQAVQATQQSLDDTLLKVNGTPIIRKEVNRALKIMLKQTGTKQLIPEALKKAQDSIIEQLTDSELLYQAAKGVEMKDLDQQVKKALADNRAKFKNDTEYQTALDELLMTQKDLEEFTRKDVAINNMIEARFGSKVQVAEADAKKFYDDNRTKYFEQGAQVRASHILIGTKESASKEEREQAKAKAEALLERIKKGEDFAEIAKKESTCPSKDKGGDLGFFGQGDMVPPFEKAAFALKPGEISGLVSTVFGYHIIKLTEANPPRVQPFDEVKAKIVEYLKREKVRAEIPALIKELREKAKIEKV